MKRIVLLAGLALLLLPAVALGDAPQPTLPLSSDAFWSMVIGAVVPLPVYIVNHYMPWCSEQAKALVHLVAAAAGGAVYKAIVSGLDFSRTSTWEVIGLSVAAAFAAHAGFYTRAKWNVSLLAGSNHKTPRRR